MQWILWKQYWCMFNESYEKKRRILSGERDGRRMFCRQVDRRHEAVLSQWVPLSAVSWWSTKPPGLTPDTLTLLYNQSPPVTHSRFTPAAVYICWSCLQTSVLMSSLAWVSHFLWANTIFIFYLPDVCVSSQCLRECIFKPSLAQISMLLMPICDAFSLLLVVSVSSYSLRIYVSKFHLVPVFH